jgi:hypothetical protein
MLILIRKISFATVYIFYSVVQSESQIIPSQMYMTNCLYFFLYFRIEIFINNGLRGVNKEE